MGESGTIDRKRLLIRPRPFMYGVRGYPREGRYGRCGPANLVGSLHPPRPAPSEQAKFVLDVCVASRTAVSRRGDCTLALQGPRWP